MELDTAGDGFFARFDGPARAIHCALAIRDAVREIGLEVRLGLHAGECEVLDAKVTGIAVAIGARVSAQAAAGEILVECRSLVLLLGEVPGQLSLCAAGLGVCYGLADEAAGHVDGR